MLKLALVQIAQGKNDEAKLLLAEAQGLLDPSDAGLALALAGDPQSAVAVLEPAARTVGADARTRQNLALAYAFAGDWEQARTVAAQDVPADQLDARIQQWMALAKPARASDQVAASSASSRPPAIRASRSAWRCTRMKRFARPRPQPVAAARCRSTEPVEPSASLPTPASAGSSPRRSR